jgi:hypothetical protein
LRQEGNSQKWLRHTSEREPPSPFLGFPVPLSDILEISLRRPWDYAARGAVPPGIESLVIFILGLAVGVCERPTFKASFQGAMQPCLG